MGMWLGTSKVDITPQQPLSLVGFGGRSGCFDGIQRRIYVRVWYFRRLAVDGTPEDTVLVQGDVLWWGPVFVRSLRPRLMLELGLDGTTVLLHASHNHSGPDTGTDFGTTAQKTNAAYVSLLEDLVITGIVEARRELEPVTLERGHGRCGFGVNRRKPVDGGIQMKPNPEGPTDPEVTVLRYTRRDGTVKGVMFHYACHPTTTMDNRISSEYPGAAMEAVEAGLGDGAAALFLQGCCGDIRPGLVDDRGEFWKGSDPEVERLGEVLAAEVLAVLRARMHPVRSGAAVKQRKLVLQLPLQAPSEAVSSVPLELAYIHLGECCGLLAMNGEMVVEYGLYAKERSHGAMIPLGYTNGMVGYVPTARQLAEGGYEAVGSIPFFGLPSPFAPELEGIIRAGVEDMLAYINGKSDRA